jgi:hypothetical protein
MPTILLLLNSLNILLISFRYLLKRHGLVRKPNQRKTMKLLKGELITALRRTGNITRKRELRR